MVQGAIQNAKSVFEKNLARLKEDPRGFFIFEDPLDEQGEHPANFVDGECAFAADHIRRAKPAHLLDIGSYRHFILGLLAHYQVTSVDVRRRQPLCAAETVLTGDAKKLRLPDESFDLVLSLCTLEHLGLGRYGDEFDPQADEKTFAEMIRVLKKGGRLVFTTTLTRSSPAVAFNAHRIYNRDMLRDFCAGLTCVEEKFYSHESQGFCSFAEITTKEKWWDVYCGCWEKD